jgi:hypothetical protein
MIRRFYTGKDRDDGVVWRRGYGGIGELGLDGLDVQRE